jgi:hypothetical protein
MDNSVILLRFDGWHLLPGDRPPRGGERPLPTIGGALKERMEDFVELGDGHGGARLPNPRLYRPEGGSNRLVLNKY